MNPIPAHGLQYRLCEVIGWHDDISRVIGPTPGKDGMEFLSGPSFLQGPVTQVHKELNIWKLNLITTEIPD